MGSLLDQLQKKSRVIIHISNPQIQQHPYAKMASFKILLVVALVAFIGSSDALNCVTKKGSAAAATAKCGDDKKSCLITATIKLKPAEATVTKQECVAGESAKNKFKIPAEIKDGAEVSFYCKQEDCNKDIVIKQVLKEDAAKTEAAMKATGAEVEKLPANPKSTLGTDGKTVAGAAQTTVAVATIAFSMIMARLAL